MYIDPYGTAPEWWQWAASGVMFVGGVVCIASGLCPTLGGALICAGVNSIIGSYTAEAAGGSSTAGWIGGGITGLICGAGAGIAGDILFAATNIEGIACIGQAALGYGIAFTTGTAGSVIGQCVTSAIDGTALNGKEVLISALTAGTINCFAAMGAGMGNALKDLPNVMTTSKVLANALNAVCGVTTEAICDTLSVVISFFQ